MMNSTNRSEVLSRDERPTRRAARLEPVVWAMGLALLALASPKPRLSAQDASLNRIDVQGTVVNKESGQPVVGAVVSLTEARTGVLTDDRGRFTLEKVKPGKVSISADRLGYESLTWKGTVGADEGPLTLELPPKDSLLERLDTVMARFQHRRRAAPVAVQSFGENDLAETTQANVMDFVNSRAGVSRVDCPGLFGSDQCYAVEGMVVFPLVYVDDEPMAGGEGYLESISPNDLYLLEVYAHGAEIRAYTRHFIARAARTDYRPLPLGL